MPKSDAFTILHLSDLHIRRDETESFDRSTVLDPLLKRVAEDFESGLKPEIVVVTGDLAYGGLKAEYDLAKPFLHDLLAIFGYTPARLFLVPGNHDVNRRRYRPTEILRYPDMAALNLELANVDYRADLLKGMTDYFAFATEFCPHLKPLLDNLIPFVGTFNTAGGRKIALVGLNSAWMCRKSPDRDEIAVGEYQIKHAEDALKGLGDYELALYLLHHPLPHLWSVDRQICRSYIDGRKTILLSGHLHEPGGMVGEDLYGRLMQFQAGGAYLGSESAWPNRYQYLTIDWNNNLLRLDFRAFDKDRRQWHVDAKTGKDGKKEFSLLPPSARTKAKAISGKTAIVPFPQKYWDWLIANYRHLNCEKLGGARMLAIELPEIFIPLYTHVTDREAVARGKGPREITTEEERNKPIDLEELLILRSSLVIEGHSGSGKTTLLKHIAYCLAQEDGRCAILAPLQGYLPILIFLKELSAYFEELKRNKRTCPDAYAILDWYCRTRLGGFLDGSTVKAFVESQHAILLLDGLDELQPDYRDTVVHHMADLQIKHKPGRRTKLPGNRIVFTGRPHGLDGAVVARYREDKVRIEALTLAQVEQFVGKWFAYFYPGSSGPGGRTAADLISEMQTHTAIAELRENPLMLTAICILYHDQRELPGQRAELYHRFVENMLYRRFRDEAERVKSFLKILAHTMHIQQRKTTAELTALHALRKVYRPEKEEPESEYLLRTKAWFGEIEAQCGLLKREAGGYEFWHLTFQEFLSAGFIVDTTTDPVNALDSYWEEEWYAEMVRLYIGFLSIDSAAIANAIVKNALNRSDRKRWLLAASALNNIPLDRRDEKEVVPLAQQRLQAVFQTKERVNHKVLAEAGELLGWLGDPRDLKAFVEIPGGDYDLEGWYGTVTLKGSFWMGKYPVTNRWYAEFVADGGYDKEECLETCWSRVALAWKREKGINCPRFWHDRKWRCPNAPVVGVSWWEAEAFCRWLTQKNRDGRVYRLPTEAEWQVASAGREKREYPWGAGIDETRCNYGEGNDPTDKTSSVGIFERGRTPDYGIYDLAGNVWEWCFDQYDDYPAVSVSDRQGSSNDSVRVVRGGSWGGVAGGCRSAVRNWFDPANRYYFLGFRLASGRSLVEPRRRKSGR